MFTRRTSWPLAANALSQRLEALRAAGTPILDLTESNPTRCSFAYSDDLLEPLADSANLRYEPSPRGWLPARESICRCYAEAYDVVVEPSQIVLMASTSEAYSWLLRLLAEPGERVLAPQPSYPLFNYLADLNDVHLDAYPLVYRDGWQVDVERLRAAVRPDTRAIIAVQPNNPTGSCLNDQELDAIRRLSRERHLALICDEVFADYRYPEGAGRFRSAAGHGDILTFTLGGVSKALGLPQVKVAWIVVSGPTSLRDEALARLEMIADTYLSVNTPAQRALPRWLAQRQAIQRQILQRLLDNRRYLVEQVATSGACQVLNADGGWYAVLRAPSVRDDEAFCLDLLERDHVLVHPGYFFDFPDPGYLVLSLLLPQKQFRDGAGRLLQRLVTTGGEGYLSAD